MEKTKAKQESDEKELIAPKKLAGHEKPKYKYIDIIIRVNKEHDCKK
jgi:hypothetical protein